MNEVERIANIQAPREVIQLFKEILRWYAAHNVTPGDGWAFSDDQSSLCFEDSHRVTGHAFWIDIDDDGVVRFLWRPSPDVPAQSVAITPRDMGREF